MIPVEELVYSGNKKWGENSTVSMCEYYKLQCASDLIIL